MSQQLQTTIDNAWENRASLSPQSAPKEVQDAVAPDAVLASNTSTLPITLLAQGVKRPADCENKMVPVEGDVRRGAGDVHFELLLVVVQARGSRSPITRSASNHSICSRIQNATTLCFAQT